ncbi:hypothetical protein BDR03DRAFT_965320 [Suillus americanus]|nr:hypothetical protein BDR03DRAFT_965320 [Suillus americanus]
MVNQSTANDTASLAESASTRSDVSSSLQPIADNVARRVKLILPQAKATLSELQSAAPEVIDVDIDENDAPPAAEQDDEADHCNGGANGEVLKAWRTITSHPQFKDADVNHLCTEFTKKARCDGTKVVLEPEGVHHILETFKAKSLAQQQQQTSTSSSN